jgi:DNA-binding beta-propeller fold protein YncE
MAANATASPEAKKSGFGTIGWWVMGVISFTLLAFMLFRFAAQLSTPITLHRLQTVEDIPLPGVFAYATPTSNPLAPGLAERFDHFDFQTIDPQTHLLFIAHTGVNPDKEHAINPSFNPDKGRQTDGNVVVFNTEHNKVVKLLNLPQVAGIIAAPDLGKVFASNATDGIVYVIDEHTFATTPIQLGQFDAPDAMDYDQADHLLIVSQPGMPTNPDKTANIDPKNQNVGVIDVVNNKLLRKIPLGVDVKKFGDDVGHVQFDPVTQHVFVVTLPLPNQDDANPVVTPPSFLAEADPFTGTVLRRIKLPDTCVNPHGFVLDAQQRVGFIACIDSQNLVRFDLRTMKADTTLLPVLFKPDILRIDHSSHVLYVACAAGISLFDESGRQWERSKLGDYFLGGGSNHTVAIDEATHRVFLPLPSVGGRPILRVVRYDPNGV